MVSYGVFPDGGVKTTEGWPLGLDCDALTGKTMFYDRRIGTWRETSGTT